MISRLNYHIYQLIRKMLMFAQTTFFISYLIEAFSKSVSANNSLMTSNLHRFSYVNNAQARNSISVEFDQHSQFLRSFSKSICHLSNHKPRNEERIPQYNGYRLKP